MEKADDSAAVAAFKTSVSESLRERFAMTSDDTARHPFVVATVLDPAVKAMADFPESLRAAAYAHVRSLVSEADAGTDRIEEADDSDEPPPKRAKQDVRAATLNFIARRGDTTQTTPTAEFDRYLRSVASPECDLLRWWRKHADAYPHCAAVARRFLAIPASSAASERLFSATGRIVDKRRSRLLPERVESLVFLNRNK